MHPLAIYNGNVAAHEEPRKQNFESIKVYRQVRLWVGGGLLMSLGLVLKSSREQIFQGQHVALRGHTGRHWVTLPPLQASRTRTSLLRPQRSERSCLRVPSGAEV